MFRVLTVLLLIIVVTFMFTFKVPFMKVLWEALRDARRTFWESWRGRPR